MSDTLELLPLSQLIKTFMSRLPKPTGAADEKVSIITSEDIMLELADMADFTLNEIAETLIAMGYEAEFGEDGCYGWRVVKK